MIRPINVSDTSFQAKGLKLRQAKKVSRQIINLDKVNAKGANALKGVAKTPVRLANKNNDLGDDFWAASSYVAVSAIATSLWC